MDARRRRHRPGRGARSSSARTAQRAASRWPTFRPIDIRSGKRCSRDGSIDPATPRHVGDVLGHIHAATADRADVAARFATDGSFDAIRLEPYLVATARAHTRSRATAQCLAADYADDEAGARARRLQPENILIGAGRPRHSRRRMRLVRRSCIRSRVRAQSPAAEGCVAIRIGVRIMSMLRGLARAYLGQVTWEPPASARGTHGRAAARPDAGAHRRQVAGRISDGGAPTRTRCAHSPAPC